MSEEKPKVAIHNEKIKLRGTFINNLAVVCITVGVAGPLVAYLLGNLKDLPLGSMLFWTSGSLFLHFLAQDNLSDMMEP